MPSSKTFSVLTVSKRTGWEDDAWVQVHKQTVKPKYWCAIVEGKNAPATTKASNLNASLNAGLREILAHDPDIDYVIFYQDFIELPEDCFEKLLALATPNTFVTTCTPNYDGSDDGRYTGTDLPRPCRPQEWETNVAIAPMGIMRKLGGFDEDYDNGWSWDNVNVAERAELLGCKFILDESNRPKLFPHEMSSRETIEPNGDRHALTMRAIKAGKKPIKLSYLD